MAVTDYQIIELYWRKNEQAILESEGKYGKYCFSIADAILQSREDSEECVNDTWLRAWSAIPPQRPERLKLFFAAITRNIALNRYKRKFAGKRGGEAAAVLDELAECVSASGDAEAQYAARELGRAINTFCRKLPAKECNVFIRRYFFSDSIPWIAENYCMTEHSVSVMLSRTRKKLRAYLNKEGFII